MEELIRRPHHGYPWDLRREASPSRVIVRDAITLKVLRVEHPDGTPMPGYKKNGKKHKKEKNHNESKH